MRTLTPGEQCQRLAVRLREPGCGDPLVIYGLHVRR